MKSELLITGTATELATAYNAWVEAVPQEERLRVANLMRSNDVQTLTGINALCMDVLAEVFAGTLSPVVATAARPWVELMIVNIHAMNQKQGTPDQAGGDIYDAMMEMKNKARTVRATYTQKVELVETRDEAGTLEIPDRILIEVEG